MANSLVRKAESKAVVYESNGEQVKLSPQIIKNYLVNGNGNVTDQEAVMFLNLCRMQHLNPFLREAYLIKYGNSPATIVTGKDTFMKRARLQPDFRGFKAGLVVLSNGKLVEREGGIILKGEELIGGWAEVYVDGYAVPVKDTVSFDEYAGRTRDGKLNSQWASKPGTMIRKVALVQAIREAFPVAFGGLYSQEEIPTEAGELPTEPIQPAEAVQPQPAEAEQVPTPDPEAVEIEVMEEPEDINAVLFG